MKIVKIVSGGQTGADRGGLDAAIAMEIPHGGWCPKGRRAEDGAIPAEYRLTETSTNDYLARTEANVVDSDATLVFTPGRPTGGSRRTIEFACMHGKPWHHVALKTIGRPRAAEEIVRWLSGDAELNDYEDYETAMPEDVVLNVAGSRESKMPGIQRAVREVLEYVLAL